MKQNLFLLLFFIVHSIIIAQTDTSFAAVDEWAKKQQYKGDLLTLVNNLTQPFTNEIEKTRAIYTWIISNIQYDIKKYNQPRSSNKFRCKKKKNCEGEYQDYEQKVIQDVLKSKLAICSGYSKLFCRMAAIAGVQCIEIEGYVKNRPKHAGEMGILDHAWNGIIIQQKMYFIDATWAAGECEMDKNNKLSRFIPKQNDFYWMANSEKFHLNHFPENAKKITNLPYSQQSFQSFPFIAHDLIPKISVQKPQLDIIHANKDDTVYFKIHLPERIEKIQINTNVSQNPHVWKLGEKNEIIINEHNINKQVYLPFTLENETYQFFYVLSENGIEYLEILFDYVPALRFKVEK